MKNKSQSFKVPANLQEETNKKRQKVKTHTLVENQDGIFEVPQDLQEFQRPETIKLEKIGDYVHGYYEGLQPVSYTSGGTGYLLLLRQGQNPSDRLIAINAGYDIRRWLLESGFDELIGEYLKVTLDKLVNTGMPAPMKQYKFGYTQNVAKQLHSGAKQTLRMLEAKNNPAVALIEEAEKMKSFSPVLEVEKDDE